MSEGDLNADGPGAGSAPAVEGEPLGALEGWLGARLGRDLELVHEGKPGSGFSAETTILRSGDDRFVLRMETPDPPVYPTQVPGLTTEVDIQYRVMTAVSSSSDVPIAPLHGYEGDPAVLGAPFFVMGFVEGVVPVESPMYTLEGFFTELAAESRTTMLQEAIDVVARVHAIDWKAAGLGWLVPDGAEPTLERQLELWSAYGQRELAGRSHPVYERAEAWLRANRPAETEPVLCWGDARPGNMIWSDDRPACVTDFEAASIAPVGMDLGWWLMFDRWAHETSGAERLPGELTRDEQRALYEERSGRAVGDTTWYEVMAAWRYNAIVVRVMNRTVERGLLPAESTLWRETNVTTCLEQLLDEHGI